MKNIQDIKISVYTTKVVMITSANSLKNEYDALAVYC